MNTICVGNTYSFVSFVFPDANAFPVPSSQVLPSQICDSILQPNPGVDALLCFTADARVCILRWSDPASNFTLLADYGSISSTTIPSFFLNQLQQSAAPQSLSQSSHSPVVNFLYPTFLPAITPTHPHPLLQPEQSPFEPSMEAPWRQQSATARSAFEMLVCCPPEEGKGPLPRSANASMSDNSNDAFALVASPLVLVAVACHLNCVLIGRLNDPPTTSSLYERLAISVLLHINRENQARISAHKEFSSDASCRRFVERLNKHLHPATRARAAARAAANAAAAAAAAEIDSMISGVTPIQGDTIREIAEQAARIAAAAEALEAGEDEDDGAAAGGSRGAYQELQVNVEVPGRKVGRK